MATKADCIAAAMKGGLTRQEAALAVDALFEDKRKTAALHEEFRLAGESPRWLEFDATPDRFFDELQNSPEPGTGTRAQEGGAATGDARARPASRDDDGWPEIEAMAETEAWERYIDEVSAADAEIAANRRDRRLELTAAHRERLVNAGYAQEQADAYGELLAAHAEQMAPVYGQTPGEFHESRFAGFREMSFEEFQAASPEALDRHRESQFQQLMADLGMTPGMSRTARRRVLQPEFAYAWGHLNPESVINTFGKSVYNQLRRQFGPGFFAKKGQRLSLDVIHGVHQPGTRRLFQRRRRGRLRLYGESHDAAQKEKP